MNQRGDERLAYIPKRDNFEITKTQQAKHWYKDDFFANELFNGLNPVTVKVVKDLKDIH